MKKVFAAALAISTMAFSSAALADCKNCYKLNEGSAWASYGGESGGESGSEAYGQDTWAGSGQDNSQEGMSYTNQNTDGPDNARAWMRTTTDGGSAAGAYTERSGYVGSNAFTGAGGYAGGGSFAEAGEDERRRFRKN